MSTPLTLALVLAGVVDVMLTPPAGPVPLDLAQTSAAAPDGTVAPEMGRPDLARTEPRGLSLEHLPPGCLIAGSEPMLSFRIVPPVALASATLYFRLEGTLYWYAMSLQEEGGVLRAVLPKPRAGPWRVEYFVEAQSGEGATATTPPRAAEIASGPSCATGGAPAEAGAAAMAFTPPPGAPRAPAGFDTNGVDPRLQSEGMWIPPRLDASEAPRVQARPGPAADVSPRVGRGSRVRVTTDGGRHVGEVIVEDAEFLVLSRPEQSHGGPLRVPKGQIRRLELSLGPASRGRWAAWGTLAGVVAASVVLAAAMDESQYESGYGVPLLFGLMLGAPAGAAAGAIAAPHDRWQEIRTTAPATSASTAAGFRFTLRF